MNMSIDYIRHVQVNELDIFLRDMKRLEAEDVENLKLREVTVRGVPSIVYYIKDFFEDGRIELSCRKYDEIPPFNEWYIREKLIINDNENGI